MTERAGVSATGPTSGELMARFTSAISLAVIAMAAVLLGGWPATVIVAVFSGIIFVEWVGMTEPGNRVALAPVAALVPAMAIWTAGWPFAAVGLMVVAAMAAGLAAGFPWRPLGVLYAGVFGLSLLALRLSPGDGIAAVLFVLAIVWCTDTAAYFGGRRLGGPKLWPAVSPNKTWSGFLAGLVAGTVAGVIAAISAGFPLSAPIAVIAAILSLAAQSGDLLESSLKRRFGKKDSSRLVPGHGGFMDRVDSLAAAAPVAAMLGWVNQPLSPASGLLGW